MKSFNIDIYETKIDVLVFEDVVSSDKYVSKVNKKYKLNYDKGGYEGCVFEINSRHLVMCFMRKYISDNVIAHECFHGSQMIADSVGLSTEGDTEDRAYLNAYINQKVREILKNYLVVSKI